MRLNRYIVLEAERNPYGGRGKSISEEDCLKLLGAHCMDAVNAYKDDEVLVRGASSDYDYQVLDPKSFTRKSMYTDNYYTLIIDNHPLWKGFPKRSQAVICTTDEDKARGYGELYYVFAYDGATYGVTSGSDIWSSFKITWGNGTGWPDLGSINMDLNHLFKNLINHNLIPSQPFLNNNSWKGFEKDIETISNGLKKGNFDSLNGVLFENHIWRIFTKQHKPFDEWFFGMYNPKTNGNFVTKDVRKIFKTSKSREVWTNSKCILVAGSALSDIDIHQFL